MKTTPTYFRSKFQFLRGMFAIALPFLCSWKCFPQGIPEPPIVLYGSIVDNRTAANTLKTNGTLRAVLSSGNEQLTFTTQLQAIDGKYSYILALPCETPVTGNSDSANYLRLRSSPLTYSIVEISLDGQKLFLESANSSSFQMNPNSRGALRQINALFRAPTSEDSDHNGLLDEWEIRYFGAIGADPNGDPDRDGETNLQEFQAGTDPKDGTFLDITVLSATPGKIRLAWESKPGSQYTIEQSGTFPFQKPVLKQQGLAGTGQRMTFEIEIDIDPSGQQTQPTFFRLIE